jgi:hypothetical protein
VSGNSTSNTYWNRIVLTPSVISAGTEMSRISLFCITMLMLLAGALIVSSESNNNKPIRSQQRHVKLANAGGIKGRSSPSNGRSSASIDLDGGRSSGKASLAPLFNVKLAATAVKDEVIDIFESIAFATSAKERVENTFDVIRRHKFLLSAGAVALVLKSTVGGKGLVENYIKNISLVIFHPNLVIIHIANISAATRPLINI